MQGSYLGPEYSDLDILKTARKFGARCHRVDDFGELAKQLWLM